MRKIGQPPVRILKKVDGFVLSRLQYTIIGEAWCLVEAGIVSVGELDIIMLFGLGMQYALIGSLETMHLNAEGILSNCDRYRECLKHVLKASGCIPEWRRSTRPCV